MDDVDHSAAVRRAQELKSNVHSSEDKRSAANLRMSGTPSSRPANAAKPLRILCLHGFRTNAQIMMDQTRGLRAALGENAEFVFFNAPFKAGGPTDDMLMEIYGKDTPYYEWGHMSRLDPVEYRENDNDIDALERLKFEDDGSQNEDEGSDRMMAYIDEQLRKFGPFDAVVGFSQGGRMATLLALWYLRHHNVQLWKVCVLFSTPLRRSFRLRPLIEESDGTPIPVPFPSIHVIGENDPLYDYCVEMADYYADHPEGSSLKKTVLLHNGGHKFPTPKRYGEMYQTIAQLILAHCGRNPPSKL